MVYDNTSGKLIPFATLEKGQTYPVIRSYGSWWQIDVAGRIGYIRKNITQIVPKPVVNPEKKYTYQQMVKDIDLLEMMYPDIIEKKIIGKSVEGRHMYAIKLGTGKKEVLINASHHAREHITTNLVMKMLDEYAYAYHKNRTIDGYNNRTKYPLINISKRKSGGGFSDWFAITQKKPAFTLEVAPYVGPKPVPLKHWDRVWKRNHSAGLILAHHVR